MSRLASNLLKLSGSDLDVGVSSASELIATRAAAHAPLSGPVLLYGFRHSRLHDALLREITGGACAGVAPATRTSTELTWTAEVAVLAPELAGMLLNLHVSDASFSSFDLRSDPHERSLEVLARIDGRPWFVRLKVGEDWVYLLGIDAIPDAEMVVSSAEQELPLVSAAIAILLFVRTHFASRAWFAPVSFGNFVIDDPLLRPVYGCVRHQELSDQVSQSGSAATIAFIPWNARRSARHTAELYKKATNLSLCVHGYEHIGAEFSTTDVDDLRWRSESAMSAMRLHRDLTGVSFEPVMVFPQGKFSSPAIEVLANAGFLGAANSSFLATDTQDAVQLKHLLEPAVTAYGSLPLFRRRSPAYVNRFRYDLVLGKPLLLVEHHGFFADHGAAFRRAVDEVWKIAPSIQWAPLGEIAGRVHLLRATRPGHREVRFYARRFRLRARESATYEFTKREGPAEVLAVTVDGRQVPFEREHDTLRFCANLECSDRDVEVVVEHRPEAPARTRRRSPGSRFSVAARRYLSEGRDNYLAGNSPVRACWLLARKLLSAG